MSGLQRISEAFRRSRPAFMPYAMLGYPSREESLAVVRGLVHSGADLLELGVPFSDPLADGPIIQAAAQRALDNGTSLRDCLIMTAQLRREGIDTPALLMGYLNPLLAYGLERLVGDAVEAGVDGFIVPDLPLEEAEAFDRLCHARGLALIYFLAPTSTPERIRLVARRARGFIYIVSITGVTGGRQMMDSRQGSAGGTGELASATGNSGEDLTVPAYLGELVRRIRSETDLSLAVGFGIQDPAQARAVGRLADGVIVGSALVRCAGRSPEEAAELASQLKSAMGE